MISIIQYNRFSRKNIIEYFRLSVEGENENQSLKNR